jgi:predicted AAA+ superfamily ATPase
MKRDIYKDLMNWKNSKRRKPLILKGARQIGKTYILKVFGENEYSNTAYINFEEDPEAKILFEGKLNPQKIIEKLSLYLNIKIEPKKSLIIFDEIQECPAALTSLKYFNEEANEYHLVTAGSLLGIKMKGITSFPVGKVNFFNLFPFSYEEYLDGIGKSNLRTVLNNVNKMEPIDIIFHNELTENLKMYFFVGGMPEAILQYKKDKDFGVIREIQNEILTAYSMDFSKHPTKSEAINIMNVWNSIPTQLAKENKKFQYNNISKHAKAIKYRNSIDWLVNAGLVYRSFNVKTPKLPISAYRESNNFKLFLLDVGLLGAMLNLTTKTIVERNKLFLEYNGAFTENYVAQELIANKCKELYYWRSGNSAEVDFILSDGNNIIPLEVKSGLSKKKKSLIVYKNKYNPSKIIRTTLMNFKKDGKMYNYPLYAVSKIQE